jgi:hypothetical protein
MTTLVPLKKRAVKSQASMVSIEVATATELQIDWLVGKIEGRKGIVIEIGMSGGLPHLTTSNGKGMSYVVLPSFSTDPAAAQPIIEREGIATRRHPESETWFAMSEADAGNEQNMSWALYTFRLVKLEHAGGRRQRFDGATQIMAAMRCHVATKLGTTVKVPKKLGPVNTTADHQRRARS